MTADPRWTKNIKCKRGNALIVADVKNKNLGDRIIFLSLSKLIYDIGFKLVYKLSDESKISGNVIHINAFNPLCLIVAIVKANAIFIGGGGIFQDSTSRFNLVYFGVVALISKLLLKRVYVVGVGVTDLNFLSSKIVVRLICFFSEFVSVRDEDSKKNLSLYCNGDIDVSPDLALSFNYNPQSVSDKVKVYSGSKLCLLTLRPQNAGSSRITNANEESVFLKELAVQVQKIVSKTNAKPVIVAFDVSKDVDYIKRYLEFYDLSNTEFIDSISPDDYCFLAERAEYVISMRLHGLILAHTRAEYLIGLEYDAKIKHFMRSIGSESNSIPLKDIKYLESK